MPTRTLFLILFAVGLLVRLYAIVVLPVGLDIRNFSETAFLANNGDNIYVRQNFYNYSPIPAHIAGVVRLTGLPFPVGWRLLTMTGDLVNGVLATMLARGKWKLCAFGMIWLNPALILFWDYSLDGLTVTPLLLACVLARSWGWQRLVSR